MHVSSPQTCVPVGGGLWEEGLFPAALPAEAMAPRPTSPVRGVAPPSLTAPSSLRGMPHCRPLLHPLAERPQRDLERDRGEGSTAFPFLWSHPTSCT